MDLADCFGIVVDVTHYSGLAHHNSVTHCTRRPWTLGVHIFLKENGDSVCRQDVWRSDAWIRQTNIWQWGVLQRWIHKRWGSLLFDIISYSDSHFFLNSKEKGMAKASMSTPTAQSSRVWVTLINENVECRMSDVIENKACSSDASDPEWQLTLEILLVY